MATRVVEGKKPYTGGEAIDIDQNKVISLKLRDENNLIIYDSGDDEIYVDLQLPDGITPTDAFPVGVTTGRVVVADGWDKAGTIICAKTTSGDNIKLLYADDGTLWIDNGTGTFKEIPLGGSAGADIEYVTQVEYDALPSSKLTDGKHYVIYTSDSPTPPSPGWQPGVNTIAYYPLDSVNTVNDLSGNNYTLTSSGTISYGTYDGVDCCSLSGQLTSAINSVSLTPGVTISIWYKFHSAPNSDNGQIIALNNGTINQDWVGALLCYGRPQADGNIAATSDRPYPYGAYDKTKWTYICVTCDDTVKLYLNGTLVGSSSKSPVWGARQGLNIGYTQKNPNCYVSKAIFEDKVRTAQEVSDYYDQTKGDYGIS